jgi:CRISPR-associated endoribonuclease Cas6
MPELAAMLLYLRPTHADTIPAWTGRATHAWFLQSLQRLQPELAAIVHDGDGPKPFTTSGLLGAESRGETVTLRPASRYTLRVTTLHPDVTHIALNGLVPDWLARGVTLHDQPFRVEAVSTDPADDPRANAEDYAGLLARTTLARHVPRQVTFTFASPTAFNKTGGLQVPLPVPELVFGSLIDRWSRFATVALHPDVRQFIAECVAVSQHRIQTRRVSYERAGRGAVTGFTGTVTFSIQSTDRFWLGQVHMLAAFAMYSGVGVRTTMGMGQARAGAGAPAQSGER